MLLGAQAAREVTTEGIEDTVKMNISLSDSTQAHIIKVLTETYKYPEKSIVRENFSNHWDSHFESNKKETPIPVKLYKNETGNYTLETSDIGLGLTEEEFYKYYLGIGESSKRDKPFLIGGMGLGCKSALSKVDSYEVICRKNNIENKFLVFKGEQYPESTKIYSKNTTEENGVTVKIPVDRYDFSDYKAAIRSQLCYFPTAHIQIDGDTFDYTNAKIFENDLFVWSEIHNESEMHISFNNCNYPIDWKLLKIEPIYLPVAIKITIDSGVKPEFNRESLEYSKETKQLIISKIKEISTWFCNKYNSEWKEYDSVVEAWNKITNTNKIVAIAGKEFQINDLVQYSDVKPFELKIKGIELKEPKYYHNLGSHIFDEYECVADNRDRRGIWRTKWVKSNHGLHELLNCGTKHILVDKVPTGKVKRYLLSKHPGKSVFIKKINTRRLGNFAYTLHNANSLNYTYVLDLERNNVAAWRGLISEFQFVENQFKALLVNETEIELSKEYQDWLIADKEFQKANRSSNNYVPKSNYKRINKQAGDITIQLGTEKEIGIGCKFVKTAVKIEKLNNLHASTKSLHIYFTEDQKEKAAAYWKLLGTKYSVCIISKNEIKKLPKIKNFMKEEEFLQSRPFCKIMTSLKYEKALDNYNEIYRNSKCEVVDNVLSKFKEQKDILDKYVRQNGKHIDDDLLEGLKEIAKLKGLYDHSLDDVYAEFVKNTDKYNFISCLKTPKSWEHEEMAKYKKLINSLLLMQQKYNNFNDLDIEVKEKPVAVTTIPEKVLENQLETV